MGSNKKGGNNTVIQMYMYYPVQGRRHVSPLRKEPVISLGIFTV